MIDLHTHTVHSDGSDTTAKLLENAQKAGVKTLSITDHDSVGAYDDLKDNAVRSLFSGEIITGTELTAVYGGELIEILGYGIDTDVMKNFISKNVRPFIKTLPEQSVLYMKAYNKIGVKFTPEFAYMAEFEPEILFKDIIAYSQKMFLDDMKKYPENARFFESYEQMMTISAKDFTRYFVYNPKSPLYVDLSPLFLSLDSAIEAIHNAGGKAFLAHTYVYSPSIAQALPDIVQNYDLDGLEAYYPTFTRENTDFLLDFAKKHNLLVSGGSDYHGLDIKPNNFLGLATENKPFKL